MTDDFKCFYINSFKQEYLKLVKKNSYKNLHDKLVNFLLNNNFSSFISGARLNGSNETPFIKRYLERGGYRLYYLLEVKTKSIILVFVHPKTGTLGISNVGKEFKKRIYTEVINAIKDNSCTELIIENNQIKW